MSCNSCSTDKSGAPKGCKSNGNCGTDTCGSGSKLAVFDWLSNMTLPNGQAPFNIYEIRFKNGRKHFFKNTENLTLSMGDVVAVESSPGHDIGTISLGGELVKVQLKKKKVAIDSEEIKKIYRKASQRDIDIWQSAREKEIETQRRGREILGRLGLKMKLSDVEYQGDGNKATFYYTADERVDFRQLIRDFASAFSIRIEMKQVGLRQEAARLGGIGSCGRELCCSTWLTDFRKVNTAAARYQQLSLNPLKLSGQCGKLKCCLNYELDTYLDALKEFPKQDTVLKTEKGLAVFIKMDIFKKLLWYTYKDNSFKWFKLSLDQVNEMIALNKNNETVASLEEYESDIVEEVKIDFKNVVGQESLTRFDRPKQKRNRKRNNRNKSKSAANTTNKKSFQKNKNKRQGNKNTTTEQQPKPKRKHKNNQRNERRNDNKNGQK
ncbi:MAG: regulatory iron-sulfur-containing complex subunit RicT [Polaribacter sp.]|nr:regulatory iron-sulfur-containing complex subunit RicT [Polaribacter sp.]